jgi:hypothetical protein
MLQNLFLELKRVCRGSDAPDGSVHVSLEDIGPEV